MSEKLRPASEEIPEDGSKGTSGSAMRKLVAAGLVAGSLAAGAEASPLEAAPTEPHVRTNAEKGRTMDFMVVPQSQEELDALIQKEKDRGNPKGPLTQTAILAYKALYAAQKNDADRLEQNLEDYYKLLNKNPDLGPITDLATGIVRMLIEDKHFPAAERTLKHLKFKAVHDQLARQLHTAEIAAAEKKRRGE